MDQWRHAMRAAGGRFAERRKSLFSVRASPKGGTFLKARGFRVAALRLLDRELGKKLLPHPEKSRRNDRRVFVFAEK